MGFLDDAKDAIDKVEDLAADHKGQVGDALSKAANAVEHKVGSEHAGQVEKAEQAAQGFVEKLKHD